MIELGKLTISDSPSFNESRRKMLRLAESLGFSSMDGSKLATLFSEITREALEGKADVTLTLGGIGTTVALKLRIEFSYQLQANEALHIFFDELKIDRMEQGTRLKIEKRLPYSVKPPCPEILDDLRQMLALPSREELLRDLKNKNEALSRSEGRTQAVLEGAPDALLIINQYGVITYLNTQAEKTFGYNRDELLGEPIEQLVPQQFRKRHPGKIAKFFSAPQTMEFGMDAGLYAQQKDGSLIPVDMKLRPLETESGTQAIASIRDITAQKEAQGSITKLSRVVEQSQVSVIITDMDGTIEYVNQSFIDTTGYSERDVVGHNPRLLQSGATTKSVYKKMWDTITAGKTWRGELVNLKKDGSPFWESTIITPIFDNDEITHFVAVKQDITEQKQMEEVLRNSEEQHRIIFENSPLGMLYFSPEGKIVDCNEQFVSLMGSKRENLIGFNTAKNASPKMREALKLALAGSTSIYEDLYTSTTGNKTLYLRAIFNPVNPDNESSEVIATLEDVTARKKTEQERDEAFNIISESINYATRIQESILPSSCIRSTLAEHFELWEPRDRVGGDIYFMKPWGDGRLLALGDCTGHGVPGAFMTLIANGALDIALPECPPGDTSAVLQRTHQLIQETLNQDTEEGRSDDGLEMGVCYLPPEGETMLYSGARFSLFSVNDGDVLETKGDKKGLGYRNVPKDVTFTQHEITLSKQCTYYMTTDGLIDQIGGEKRRGFGKKRFKALLLELESTPFSERSRRLLDVLKDYQGDEKRRDDVAVVGFKV